ncbi:MAG: hypothetical protein IJY42_03580 [Clostridia bacterium]|nr:hypothetical protein [Clostridia bacterium]
MKKTLRIVALAMVAVMLCLCLASCGKKLSGTYENDATALGTGVVTTYEFSGSKVTLTVTTKLAGAKTGEVVLEGTYTIEDDEITFEFEGDEEDAEKYSTTYDFKEDEDSITIGVVTYELKD